MKNSSRVSSGRACAVAVGVLACLCLLPAQADSIASETNNSLEAGQRDDGPSASVKLHFSGKYECFIGLGPAKRIDLMMFKPLPSQAFEARLYDSTGRPIAKTRNGRKFGKPPKPDPELIDPIKYRTLSILRDERTLMGFDAHIWDLNVLDSFRIKEPGQYRLEVEVRLFVKNTNGALQPIVLPPAEVSLIVDEGDIRPRPPWSLLIACASAVVLLVFLCLRKKKPVRNQA
jgi:hypothetical protein